MSVDVKIGDKIFFKRLGTTYRAYAEAIVLAIEKCSETNTVLFIKHNQGCGIINIDDILNEDEVKIPMEIEKVKQKIRELQSKITDLEYESRT